MVGAPEVHFEFQSHELSYAFLGHFLSAGKRDCLLNVAFDFSHLRQFAPSWVSLTRLEEGEGFYRVKYESRIPSVSSTSIYRKTLDRAAGRVEFVLEEHLIHGVSSFLVPKMTASNGAYEITAKGEMFQVRYRQNLHLEKGLASPLLLSRAKREAVDFLKKFARYTNEICR